MTSNFLFNLLSKLKLKPYQIEALRGDGSNRKFYRVFLKRESLILIWPQKGEYGLKEARSYYLLGNFFRNHKIPVPEIKIYEPKKGILLVEDLGDYRLYDLKKKSKKYYYQTLEHLCAMQSLKDHFPIENTLEAPFYTFEFLWEKEVKYFLEWYGEKYQKIIFDKASIDELKTWLKNRTNFNHLVVMHRDFQSKNLMVKKSRVYIIDFQGARIGPPTYDIASLLNDPYVNLGKNKEDLLNYYLNLVSYDRELFRRELRILSLIRIMQALGAYCRLFLKEKKNWFRNYIPSGEEKLKKLIKDLKREEGEKNLPSLFLFLLRFFCTSL
ncbi:MAG: phosphotransferase [Thermodesulfobacteriaceae bacterium]|nr:phosphotransferase [Thermodesulfobacteriaceae bacterium]